LNFSSVVVELNFNNWYGVVKVWACLRLLREQENHGLSL